VREDRPIESAPGHSQPQPEDFSGALDWTTAEYALLVDRHNFSKARDELEQRNGLGAGDPADPGVGPLHSRPAHYRGGTGNVTQSREPNNEEILKLHARITDWTTQYTYL
jgi:hypothetical protein